MGGQVFDWCFQAGLRDYLLETIEEQPRLPEPPFTGSFTAEHSAVDWALCWLPEGGNSLAESYVNLIPTVQGGTHVNVITSYSIHYTKLYDRNRAAGLHDSASQDLLRSQKTQRADVILAC